jgi:MoaA/NifB/PqqE/SkfB family radical SAM enzyme
MSDTHHAASVTFLQVEPTTRCNFTCGFCCGRHMDQSDQSWDDFQAALDAFPGLRHLEIQGEGEPLLHPRFFEMATLAKARGIKTSTITNGSLIGRRIQEILDSGISSLMVSIESADTEAFRAIRGGRLEDVTDGITALIQARDARCQDSPAVGFALTVLGRTKDQLTPVFDLYERLGMDGGILCHMLSPMTPYAQHYSAALRGDVMSELTQSLVWARYARNVRRSTYHERSVGHFWNDLMGTATDQRSGPADVSAFTSCPWLEQALFVNRHGVATACPNVKDTDRFAFGHVRRDSAARILDSREEMRRQLATGVVPEACQGCFIADSIARSVNPVEGNPIAK